MKKNRLGNTDLYVSPVAFGVMTMGRSQMDLPLDEGAELIRYAFAKGINFFDTAQYYETYPYIREAFRTLGTSASGAGRPVICTKSLCLSYEEMEYAIEEALREMEIDRIDIFLLNQIFNFCCYCRCFTCTCTCDNKTIILISKNNTALIIV